MTNDKGKMVKPNSGARSVGGYPLSSRDPTIKRQRQVYVDTITLIYDNLEEVRGYLDTEHTDHWLVYKFSDETIRIPAHQVKMVVTTEEYINDE